MVYMVSFFNRSQIRSPQSKSAVRSPADFSAVKKHYDHPPAMILVIIFVLNSFLNKTLGQFSNVQFECCYFEQVNHLYRGSNCYILSKIKI